MQYLFFVKYLKGFKNSRLAVKNHSFLITGIYCCLFAIVPFGSALSQQKLSVTEAIEIALKNNLDIALSKNDETIAEVQNNWGNAGRLPTVSGQAGYTFSSNSLDQRLSNGTNIKRAGASFQSENASVTAQWRIFNGFRVTAAKKRLEVLEEIGNLGVKEQANQTVYNVISAYLNVLRFEAQIAATKEAMLLVEERVKLAENRFNIGTSGKSDFLQATVDYNQAKNSVLQSETAILQSKTLLNNLLVRNPDEAFTLTDTVPPLQLPNRAGILESIDTMNPSLLIAKSQQLVLMQQAREINAQRLPTLSLQAGAGLNNSINSAGFTLRNTTYGPTAGLTLAVPIYQGGVVKQQLKVNQIMQQSQDLQVQQLKNNLLTSLANAFNNYEFAQQALVLEKENLVAVKENNFIAMERFRKGSITTVELRQTQFNLIESNARKINAEYDMLQAQADVFLIMGKLVD